MDTFRFNPDHDYPHGLGGNMDHEYQHRPQLQQNWNPDMTLSGNMDLDITMGSGGIAGLSHQYLWSGDNMFEKANLLLAI